MRVGPMQVTSPLSWLRGSVKRLYGSFEFTPRTFLLLWSSAKLAMVALFALTLVAARLGLDINAAILEKALSLDLRHFEEPAVYDQLTRARREASSRPLSMV